jgi:hypothetical protein
MRRAEVPLVRRQFAVVDPSRRPDADGLVAYFGGSLPTQFRQRLARRRAGESPTALFLYVLWRKIARTFELLFRPEAVVAGTARRQGDCRGCGACCEIIFRCPHFDREKRECRIYESRYGVCRMFPARPEDLAGLEAICSYSFQEPEPATITPSPPPPRVTPRPATLQAAVRRATRSAPMRKRRS